MQESGQDPVRRSEIHSIPAQQPLAESEYEEVMPYIFDESEQRIVNLKTRRAVIQVKHIGEDYYGTKNNREVWCPIYSFPAIDWLVHEIQYAQANAWDQVVVITGRERSGKSDFALHLVYRLMDEKGDPLQNIAWTHEEFADKVLNAKMFDIVWMDEAGEALFSQEWMKKEQKELVRAFLRSGIKRLIPIIVLPHISLLNKQLRERRVLWWVEVYAADWGLRGYAQIRKAPIKQNPFRVETYWRGEFTVKFPPFSSMYPDIWARYEQAKLEALKRQDEMAALRMGISSKAKLIKQEPLIFKKWMEGKEYA